MKFLKVKPSETRFGLRDAIEVNPLMFCESCNHVVRESEMTGDICNICYNANEGKEVMDSENLSLKAQGDSAPHSRGERELKPDGPDGQLSLNISRDS